MGSNKLKVKKKVKVKRLKKFRRRKKIKRTKFSASKLSLEPNFVESLSGIQDISNNRFSDQEIYSRFYIDDDIPKIKKIIQVREQYFGYLQAVIKDNCAFYGSPVAEDIVDSLSLKLEQHVLLSSLQIDIYENFLTKIISDIKKCTKERQIHIGVEKLLSDSEDKEAEYEKCLKAAAKPIDCNLSENDNTLADESAFDSEALDQSPSYGQQYYEPYILPQDSDQLSFISDIRTDDDCETGSNDNSNFGRREPELLQSNEVEISPASREDSSPLQSEFDSSNKNEDLNSVPLSPQDFAENETSETVGESSQLIQKCVKQMFGKNEMSDESPEENDERDYLIQMLEEQNTSNDMVDNFENGAESAENDQEENENKTQEQVEREMETERSLAKRLERMRSLFNTDEERSKQKVRVKLTKKKISKEPNENKEAERRLRHLSAWKNEKIIQLYKVSILTSRLTYEKREEMQKLFIELFGEDSDEEHEFEYGSTYQFKTSCTERISPWVVKHLMPFYNKRRIIGRDMFKNLSRHISEAIIDRVQYPDERTVRYFVNKFFPPNKIYKFKSKRRYS